MKRKRFFFAETLDYSSSEYFHITFKPVCLVPEELDEQKQPYIEEHPRHFSSGTYEAEEQGDYLSDLVIDAMAKKAKAHELYSWDFEYLNVYSIKLYDARLMTKTLNKIDRKLKVFQKKWGAPQYYGDYVKRIAYALNIQGIIVNQRDGNNGDWFMLYPVEDANQAVAYLTYKLSRQYSHLVSSEEE